MKIFNRRSVFAMSMDRSRAVNRIRGFSDPITEHIIKCVVYGNTTNDLHHWVCHEICDYLEIVNDITVRPHDKKLKAHDYLSNLYGAMGDTRIDASILVRTFAAHNRRTKEYPDFKVTDDIIDRTFFAFKTMMTDTIPILTTKNKLESGDFIPIVCKAIQLDPSDLP